MGSTFGGTWDYPVGGFFKSAVKGALKQDQIFHMEGVEINANLEGGFY